MIHADLKIGDGRLMIWKTVETVNDLLAEIQRPDTLADFQKIKTEKRQLEFLVTRVMLKKMLVNEFYVFYTQSGKPFLADNRCNISVSHSGGWVAVAIHPNLHVGIDIECDSDRIQKLYKRFLSQAEQNDLSNGADLRQLQIAWSAKEALYKIIGKEAVDFARQLRIYPFQVNKEGGKLTAEHTVSGKFYDLNYYRNNDYTLVYCMV